MPAQGHNSLEFCLAWDMPNIMFGSRERKHTRYVKHTGNTGRNTQVTQKQHIGNIQEVTHREHTENTQETQREHTGSNSQKTHR